MRRGGASGDPLPGITPWSHTWNTCDGDCAFTVPPSRCLVICRIALVGALLDDTLGATLLSVTETIAAEFRPWDVPTIEVCSRVIGLLRDITYHSQRPIHVALSPSSKVVFLLSPPHPQKVTLQFIGSLVQMACNSEWRMILRNRWFEETGDHGERGIVYAVRSIRGSDGALELHNGLRHPSAQLYCKIFVATTKVAVFASPDVGSDVVGSVGYGEERTAIGLVEGKHDRPSTTMEYVVWDQGGYSPVHFGGDELLCEKRLAHVQVFDQPCYYTPTRDKKPVRIRRAPDITADEIGEIEVNEVRRVNALHFDDNFTECYVEWAREPETIDRRRKDTACYSRAYVIRGSDFISFLEVVQGMTTRSC